MDASGWSFKQSIFSACKNIDAKIGWYAGSADSYDCWPNLTNVMIRSRHYPNKRGGVLPEFVSNFNIHSLDCPSITDPTVLSKIRDIKFIVKRNFKGFNMCPNISRADRATICDRVRQACEKFTDSDLQG